MGQGDVGRGTVLHFECLEIQVLTRQGEQVGTSHRSGACGECQAINRVVDPERGVCVGSTCRLEIDIGFQAGDLFGIGGARRAGRPVAIWRKRRVIPYPAHVAEPIRFCRRGGSCHGQHIIGTGYRSAVLGEAACEGSGIERETTGQRGSGSDQVILSIGQSSKQLDGGVAGCGDRAGDVERIMGRAAHADQQRAAVQGQPGDIGHPGGRAIAQIHRGAIQHKGGCRWQGRGASKRQGAGIHGGCPGVIQRVGKRQRASPLLGQAADSG